MNQYKITISSMEEVVFDNIQASSPEIAIKKAYNRLWKNYSLSTFAWDSKRFGMTVNVQLLGKMVMIELKPEHTDSAIPESLSKLRQYILESDYKAPDFDSNRWQLAKDKTLNGRFLRQHNY